MKKQLVLAENKKFVAPIRAAMGQEYDAYIAKLYFADEGLLPFDSAFKHLYQIFTALIIEALPEEKVATAAEEQAEADAPAPRKLKLPSYTKLKSKFETKESARAFPELKVMMEKLLYYLQPGRMDEGVRLAHLAGIAEDLKICGPGCFTKFQQTLDEIESPEHLTNWLTRIRTNIYLKLCSEHAINKRVHVGMRVHVGTAFAKYMLAKGWIVYGYEKVDGYDDHFSNVAGLRIDADVTKWFDLEFLARYNFGHIAKEIIEHITLLLDDCYKLAATDEEKFREQATRVCKEIGDESMAELFEYDLETQKTGFNRAMIPVVVCRCLLNYFEVSDIGIKQIFMNINNWMCMLDGAELQGERYVRAITELSKCLRNLTDEYEAMDNVVSLLGGACLDDIKQRNISRGFIDTQSVLDNLSDENFHTLILFAAEFGNEDVQEQIVIGLQQAAESGVERVSKCAINVIVKLAALEDKNKGVIAARIIGALIVSRLVNYCEPTDIVQNVIAGLTATQEQEKVIDIVANMSRSLYAASALKALDTLNALHYLILGFFTNKEICINVIGVRVLERLSDLPSSDALHKYARSEIDGILKLLDPDMNLAHVLARFCLSSSKSVRHQAKEKLKELVHSKHHKIAGKSLAFQAELSDDSGLKAAINVLVSYLNEPSANAQAAAKHAFVLCAESEVKEIHSMAFAAMVKLMGSKKVSGIDIAKHILADFVGDDADKMDIAIARLDKLAASESEEMRAGVANGYAALSELPNGVQRDVVLHKLDELYNAGDDLGKKAVSSVLQTSRSESLLLYFVKLGKPQLTRVVSDTILIHTRRARVDDNFAASAIIKFAELDDDYVNKVVIDIIAELFNEGGLNYNNIVSVVCTLEKVVGSRNEKIRDAVIDALVTHARLKYKSIGGERVHDGGFVASELLSHLIDGAHSYSSEEKSNKRDVALRAIQKMAMSSDSYVREAVSAIIYGGAIGYDEGRSSLAKKILLFCLQSSNLAARDIGRNAIMKLFAPEACTTESAKTFVVDIVDECISTAIENANVVVNDIVNLNRSDANWVITRALFRAFERGISSHNETIIAMLNCIIVKYSAAEINGQSAIAGSVLLLLAYNSKEHEVSTFARDKVKNLTRSNTASDRLCIVNGIGLCASNGESECVEKAMDGILLSCLQSGNAEECDVVIKGITQNWESYSDKYKVGCESYIYIAQNYADMIKMALRKLATSKYEHVADAALNTLIDMCLHKESLVYSFGFKALSEYAESSSSVMFDLFVNAMLRIVVSDSARLYDLLWALASPFDEWAMLAFAKVVAVLDDPVNSSLLESVVRVVKSRYGTTFKNFFEWKGSKRLPTRTRVALTMIYSANTSAIYNILRGIAGDQFNYGSLINVASDQLNDKKREAIAVFLAYIMDRQREPNSYYPRFYDSSKHAKLQASVSMCMALLNNDHDAVCRLLEHGAFRDGRLRRLADCAYPFRWVAMHDVPVIVAMAKSNEPSAHEQAAKDIIHFVRSRLYSAEDKQSFMQSILDSLDSAGKNNLLRKILGSIRTTIPVSSDMSSVTNPELLNKLIMYMIMRQGESSSIYPRPHASSKVAKLNAAAALYTAICNNDTERVHDTLQGKSFENGRLGEIAREIRLVKSNADEHELVLVPNLEV